MKNWTKRLVVMVMVLALTNVSVWAAEVSFGSKEALQDDAYTLEEMLQYALEDERMAQAEYAAIIEAFDVTRPFANILQAEGQHEAAILALYATKGIEVPDFDGSEHVTIPETLDETYAIGIQAELDNIAMYDAFLAQDLDDDVRLTFEVLQRASTFHLNAFRRASGEDVTPGPRNGRGNGASRGLGGSSLGGHRNNNMDWEPGQRLGGGNYQADCPFYTEAE